MYLLTVKYNCCCDSLWNLQVQVTGLLKNYLGQKLTPFSKKNKNGYKPLSLRNILGGAGLTKAVLLIALAWEHNLVARLIHFLRR